MIQAPLIPHPSSAERAVSGLRVSLVRERGGWLRLEYALEGELPTLRLEPPRPDAGFTDRLWEHTCFELFLRRPDRPSYYELNVATSGDWAAYAFDAYRAGMRPLTAVNPQVEVRQLSGTVFVLVKLRLAALQEELASVPLSAAPSVVVENIHGQRSFWAARHAASQPDFHHADAFCVQLDAAEH